MNPDRNGRDQVPDQHACSCRSCRARWLAFGPDPTVCPFCGHTNLRIVTRRFANPDDPPPAA